MTKIELSRKGFIDALRIGGSMAGKAKATPILNYAKIAIKGNVIKITSYDTECAIAHKFFLSSGIEGDCTFVVSAKDLANALKSLRGEMVSLNIGDSFVEITHDNGTMSIPTMSADVFPVIQLEENAKSVTLSSRVLFDLVNRGKEFMSSDEFHPIMCGLYLYVKGGSVGVAATDTHKLYTESAELANVVDIDVNAVVQARAIAPLLDIINGTDVVDARFGERSIVFKTEDSMLSVVTHKGRFPHFASVLPKESSINCTIDKESLLDAVNRAILFANTTCLLKLTINGMSMAIDTDDFDTQKKAHEECMCQADVLDSFLVGVNGVKFRTVLGACAGDTVTLQMNAANRPILITEDSKQILLMPMLVE